MKTKKTVVETLTVGSKSENEQFFKGQLAICIDNHHHWWKNCHTKGNNFAEDTETGLVHYCLNYK